MKNAVFGILGVYLSLLGISAHADGQFIEDGNFHPVLVCDGGTDGGVVVDNRYAYQRGVGQEAQVVIHNQAIASYFERSGFPSYPTNDPAQWIGQSGLMGGDAGNTLSFPVSEAYNPNASVELEGQYSISVSYDGSGLDITLDLPGTVEHASWYFRNCARQ